MSEIELTADEHRQLLALITSAVVSEPAGNVGTRRRNAWLALLKKVNGSGTVIVARKREPAS